MDVNSTDDIATIWDHLYFESIPYGRKGVALMALSGVDLALWDLLGKQRGEPVWHLLGLGDDASRPAAIESSF